MADWEDEDFEPPPLDLKDIQQKNPWDDEDVEKNDDVKDNWEDEEDPVQAPKTDHSALKPGGKDHGKKEEHSEVKTTEIANKVLADPVAEELCRRRLEEANYKSTVELFDEISDEKSLENFVPNSENDFLEYAELLSYKVHPYEKSSHYVGLLKSVMKHCLTSLKAADVDEIASSVKQIADDKFKAEKEANEGKKKKDEDPVHGNVKEFWEDEEDPVQAPKTDHSAKEEELSEVKTTEIANKVLADPVAEELCRRRLEEANYKSTVELFDEISDEKSLENFVPNSENDFLEYAELLSRKIRPYKKSSHYVALLKSVMKHCLTSLKAADVEEIASSVKQIADDKLKAEKEANEAMKKVAPRW